MCTPHSNDKLLYRIAKGFFNRELMEMSLIILHANSVLFLVLTHMCLQFFIKYLQNLIML